MAFTLPQNAYRFRADYEAVQYWSGTVDHCTIPGCTAVTLVAGVAPTATPTEVGFLGSAARLAKIRPAPILSPLLDPDAVVVTVVDTDAVPQEGLPVYVFDGTAYTGLSGVSNEDGEVAFDLPDGAYRFRADLNGTQFWSGEANHCTVPGCTEASITVTIPVTITVQDTTSQLKEGLPVYAFSGGTYTGYHGTTDADGQVQLTLPQGDYRFRGDLNGTQFWSDETDHCSLPGCLAATVVVTLPVTVKVTDTDAVPQEALPVYVFDGATFTGYHGTTDAAGEVAFTLPQGDYRFRADLNGTQFWSGTTDHCAIPGCENAVVTVTIPVTVTVQSQTGSPYPDLPLYAFDGESYTGYHGTSDANGQVSFTLPLGDYRFRADYTLAGTGDGVQFWSGGANHCTIPGCLEALVEIPGGTGAVSVTIDYTYDPLQRLVAADYSTGEYFHYSYDAVGNRLTQDTLAGTNTYAYDIANRLVEVDGVPFTWDDNGNLLNDGVSEYAYNHADRLTSVEIGDDTYEFEYNGLGDRLRQIVNGESTEYTLDLAAELTQVLSYGDNALLYGVGRIALGHSGESEYFLGDALDSARQLINDTGMTSLEKSYEPYGDLLSATGEMQTPFGFAGEWRDATGLVYLRARYMYPAAGIFTQGDVLRFDTNTYSYARANPVRYTDPRGLFSVSEIARSLGGQDFQDIRSWFEQHPDGYAPRWGFLQLLLDAEDLDVVNGISLSTAGVIHEAPIGFFLRLADCRIGVFADRVYALPEYVESIPQVAARMGLVGTPRWRTVVHRYRLSGGAEYRDTHYTDLPDYFAVAWGGEIPEVLGVHAMILSDRYGNDYFGVSAEYAWAVAETVFQYQEGYIQGSEGESGRITHPLSESELYSAIKGAALGVGYGLGFVSTEGSINLQIPPYLEATYAISIFDFLSAGVSGDYVVAIDDIPETRGWADLDYIPYSNVTTILNSASYRSGRP